jgi:hypothetical protein
MRKAILTMVLVGLLALPVGAQFGFFGGGGLTGDALLTNKSVQKELGLKEDDAEAVTKAQREFFRKLFGAGKEAEGDEDKAKEIRETAQKDYNKALAKVKDGLSKDQKKRFGELEYHVAAQTGDLAFLKREDIQKGLKLTKKQKGLVTTAEDGLKKDVKEVFDDAKESGSFDFGSIMTKVRKLNKDAFESVTKTFDDDQKKVWKEKSGKAFKFEPDQFGKGKGKFKGKKKKDDD